MKINLIILGVLLQVIFATSLSAQVFNDGAAVTIEEGALLHIDGNFTNQGGMISNDGLIEIGGNWSNTIMTNPLNPNNGEVLLVGTDQTFGGDFPTLFNDVNLQDNQRLTLSNTVGINNTIHLANGIVTLNENTLHLTSSATTALTASTGGIIAETADTYGFLRWDVGEEMVGTYSIPFINDNGNAVDIDFTLNAPGVGVTGYMLFSTYGTDEANEPFPIGVSNILISGEESGNNLVDRFWVLEPMEYTTTPTGTASLSFDDSIEIGGTNDIVLDNVEVVRWDGVSAWESLASLLDDDNTVRSESIDVFGTFGLWSNFTTSVVNPELLIDLAAYPNPTADILNLEFSSESSHDADVRVFNLHGQELHSINESITTGNNYIQLSTKDLVQGNYIVLISSDELQAIQKFTKL